MAAVATAPARCAAPGYFDDARPSRRCCDLLDLVAAGHGLRRDAADRPQPRARRAGAAGHGAPRAAGHRGAAGSGAGQGRAHRALTSASRSGPRINASGRIGESRPRACACCWSDDPVEARAMAERLDAINRRRQEVEAEVLERRASRWPRPARRRATPCCWSCGEGWHPGVVGIVAGRVKERFNRPALRRRAWPTGSRKGSGRSVPGLDLGAAVIAARQAGLLETGGGHAMAAGFSFAPERLDGVARLPERAPRAVPRTCRRRATWRWKARSTVGRRHTPMAEQVARLAPFGAGNEEPVFALRHARVARADRVGKEGAHRPRSSWRGREEGASRPCASGRRTGPLAELLLSPRRRPLAPLRRAAGRELERHGHHLPCTCWTRRRPEGFRVVPGRVWP